MEAEQADHWDDYKVPENLPRPKEEKTPVFWIPLAGGMVIALLLGFAIAFFSVGDMYVIELIEVGIAFALGFGLKHLIVISNYTDYGNLKKLLIGMVIIICASNPYFQYLLITNAMDDKSLGFMEFMKLRFEAGIVINSIPLGKWMLVIYIIIQFVLIYVIGLYRLAHGLILYQLNRVPTEVRTFVSYHLAKGKTEEQVRSELSKMGWKRQQNQNEAFESVAATQSNKDGTEH